MSYVLAIDQGTTSSRAIVFDEAMAVVATAQEEFPQHFPQSGWVEHDPADIWSTTAGVCRGAIERAGARPADIAAIGITNQRETTLVWDRATGQPIHNAIVWQDRRTAAICADLRAAGHEPMITERTGLLLDPYFSGTKLKWLLDTIPGARDRARAGELMFGTVDSYLIWKLTGETAHATDATNAARTLLYNIREGGWDAEICALLDVPMADAARGARLRRRLRRHPRRSLRPRDPDPRRRRRPAGGDGRPGVFRARHAEIDLRHRLLRAAQHRRHAGHQPQPPARHHRLPARRQADLCARRLDLHRRRGGAVAARRAEDHPRRRRDPRRWPSRPTRTSISTWCPPSPASARPTGTPTPAARSMG